jgi:hypothetical protein
MISMLSSAVGARLSTKALEGNLIAVSRWDARTETPDMVAFADLRFFSTEVASQWSRGSETDPVGHFPYPKRGGGVRQISVLSVRDVVRLRTAIGEIARVANTLLTPTVYSAKLRVQPPVWYFKDHLYPAFQQAALRLCRYWESDGMVRTDVHAYYPNMQVETLLRNLWDCTRDKEAVRFVIQALMSWQDRDELPGIPVGPEACAVLGALYLRDFDAALAPLATGYFRYSDDIIYFFKRAALADAGLPLVRTQLQNLQLQMKEEKTFVYDDPDEAAEAIRRSLLDYVDGQFLRSGGADSSEVCELFDEEIASVRNPDPVTYAWCLNRLMRGHTADGHALNTILERPELMSLDPRITAAYLIRCASSNSDATSVMAARLSVTRDDPASTLHTLRYLAAARISRGQTLGLLEIARDPTLLPPVRAWALEASARGSGFSPLDIGDCVDSDTPKPVRRAAALTLRHLSGQRGRRFVARDLTTKYPDTRWAASWAAEIAA